MRGMPKNVFETVETLDALIRDFQMNKETVKVILFSALVTEIVLWAVGEAYGKAGPDGANIIYSIYIWAHAGVLLVWPFPTFESWGERLMWFFAGSLQWTVLFTVITIGGLALKRRMSR